MQCSTWQRALNKGGGGSSHGIYCRLPRGAAGLYRDRQQPRCRLVPRLCLRLQTCSTARWECAVV